MSRQLKRAGYSGGQDLVPINSSTTLSLTHHSDKTILVTSSTVSLTITLPAATGSAGKYRIVLGANLSSATVTITATGAHMFGIATILSDDTTPLAAAMVGFAAGGATNITLNGTTKGGDKGDIIEIEDVATGILAVNAVLGGSGTEASPFS